MEIIGVVTAQDLFQIEVEAGLYLVNLMVGFVWEEASAKQGRALSLLHFIHAHIEFQLT